MTPDRRTLLALFAIAFGLRILYAAVVGSSPEINPNPITPDFNAAVDVQEGWSWLTEPFTYRAPGYALLLGTTFRAFGAHLWAVYLLQAFLGAFTTLFLYRIGERSLGAGVGLLSAVWLGIYVHHMHWASIAGRGILSTLLLVWFCYAIVKRFQRMRQSLWAAVLYTALIHVDAQFVVLFPFVLLFLLLAATRHRLMNLQYTFLFFATVLVLTVPWTVRNYAVYGEVTPIALEANRYTAPLTSPPPEAPGGDVAEPGVLRDTVEFWRVVRLTDTPASETAGLREEPAWSLRHNAISAVNYGLLLPFFVIGVALAFKRRHRPAMVVAGLTLAYALMRSFLGGSEQARLPVEPFIILLAFYGLIGLAGWVRGRRAAASG